MISAKVELNQPLRTGRQFVAQTGSGHHLLLDDAAGGTGPSRSSWLRRGWLDARLSMSSPVLRQKYHQKVLAMRSGLRPIKRTVRRRCSQRCEFTTWSLDWNRRGRARGSDSPIERSIAPWGPWCRRRRAFTPRTRSLRKRPSGETGRGLPGSELRTRLKFITAAIVAAWFLQAAMAQPAAESSPLTLQQAVNIALEGTRCARRHSRTQEFASADVREARSVAYASADVLRDSDRGNDPVYVFAANCDSSASRMPTRAEPVEHAHAHRKLSTRFGGTGICLTPSPVGTV